MAPSCRSFEELRIQAATRGQSQLAADVLDAASARLEGMGLTPWHRPFPIERLLPPDTGAVCFLAWDGIAAVGTFTLQRRDPIFWPAAVEAIGGLQAWGADGTRPVYLHRFATKSGYPGLGAVMLARAEETAHGWGATCLRLDCNASNPWIRRYYEDHGFHHVGEARPFDWLASLYEKQLGPGRP
jgi:GNAT superfamily N-acetyltransferase